MKNDNAVATLLTGPSNHHETRIEALRVLCQLRREVGGEHPRFSLASVQVEVRAAVVEHDARQSRALEDRPLA
jgi:hypothetical protein